MGLSAQLHPTPGSICHVQGTRLYGSRANKGLCLPGGLVIRPDTGHCTGKGVLGMARCGKACPGRAPQTVSWSWWVRLLDLSSPRTRLGASLGSLPSPSAGMGAEVPGWAGLASPEASILSHLPHLPVAVPLSASTSSSSLHHCAQSLTPVQLFAAHCLEPTSLLSSWDSPVKNTEVGCYFLLRGIFPSQGSNPSPSHLLNWQAGSLPLTPPGKPTFL